MQKPKREIKCRFFAILQIYNFAILQKGQASPLSFLYEKVLKISRILQYCTVCDITKNGHFSLFPLPFLVSMLRPSVSIFCNFGLSGLKAGLKGAYGPDPFH